MCLHRKDQAGADDLVIHTYRTGAANPVLTADMGARELEMIPQEIRQIKTRHDLRVDTLAVDLKGDLQDGGHSGSRASSELMQRLISTLARCRRIDAEPCWSSWGSSSWSSATSASDSMAGVTATLTSLRAALADTGRSPTAKKTSLSSLKASPSRTACAANPVMA